MAAKDLTWKETKILLGNVGALKYFKIWFENQAFTKAKLNSNHFFGTTDKPTAAKKYGLNLSLIHI